MEALEERLGSDLEDLCGVVEKATAEVREEQAQEVRRLANVEAGRCAQDSSIDREMVEKRGVEPAWRPYRDVVTAEPEPGEEQVYGDATPLIVEWRRVSAEYMNARDVLSRAIAEERMRELEIELIEDRKLTLPPSTYPWDGFDRRRELWTRRQALRGRVCSEPGRNRGSGCVRSSHSDCGGTDMEAPCGMAAKSERAMWAKGPL